jgi:hypothetical protein
MTYMSSDGELNLIPFLEASVVTAIASVALFYPLGIYSGLRENNYFAHSKETPKRP